MDSLRKETDEISKERKKKLEETLKIKQEELKELTQIWESQKEELERIKQLKYEIETAKNDLEIKRRENNFAEASKLQYDTIPSLEHKLNELIKEQEKEDKNSLLHESVTSDDIARVISKATGIPVTNMMKGEKDKLLYIEESLKGRVVGQDDAIASIANAIRLQRAGLTDEKRPIASFMFLGPTGTGKTELTKAVADFLFDDENAIIRFDMSEFQEKHSIMRLIGAPPSYVGYEEGGELTEQVRRRPYSVVLFDEFEKAHKDVSKLLLQVLDEGKLTDSQGNKIDFRNTLIVMTSNIGQELMLQDNPNKEEVMNLMKSYYSPEFINRIDETVIFNKLSKEALRKIVDLRIDELQSRLVERRIELKLDEAAKEWLTENGYEPRYGARPLNRLIKRKVLNPMSVLLLKGEIKDGSVVDITAKDGDLVITPTNEPVE